MNDGTLTRRRFAGLTLASATLMASDGAAVERQALPGRIIRSLGVDPGNRRRILAGHKGGDPGQGLVFQSNDGGRTWRTANGGRALSPAATDVQAVAHVGPDRILAGTWKFGLFVSDDDGTGFRPQAGTSRDIRAIQVARANPDLVYVASARDGIFRSADGGRTWAALGPDSTFFWALTVAPAGAQVYAVSLEKRVVRSADSGANWTSIFTLENTYDLAVAPHDPTDLALATERGIFRSTDHGASWVRLDQLPAEKFAAVCWHDGALLAGSWTTGVYRFDPATGGVSRLEEGVPVVHLALTETSLLIATWGHGLILRHLDGLDAG